MSENNGIVVTPAGEPLTNVAGANSEEIRAEAGTSSGEQLQEAAGTAGEAEISQDEQGKVEAAPQKTEEEVKFEEDKKQWDSRFANLSRKEKAILQREQSIKDMSAKIEAYEKAQAGIKENPMAVLEQMGMSFDELVNHQLNIGQEPKELSADDKYRSLEEKIQKMDEDRISREKNVEKENADRQVSSFKADIVDFIEEKGEELSTIHTLGEHDLVFNVIEEHYNNTGEIMEVEEAAKGVEAKLQEMVLDVAKLPKYKKLLGLGSPQEVVKEEVVVSKEDSNQNDVRVKIPSPTLSNKSIASTTPSRTYSYDNKEESLKEAAKLLKWD